VMSPICTMGVWFREVRILAFSLRLELLEDTLMRILMIGECLMPSNSEIYDDICEIDGLIKPVINEHGFKQDVRSPTSSLSGSARRAGAAIAIAAK